MPKTSTKSHPIFGIWNIVSMTTWDEDYFNEEQQAFIEFKDKGRGEFHFGYVHGDMDYRQTERDGEPAVEWTWEGNDEMDAVQGRGWVVLKGKELHGMLFCHQGEESGFVAKRSKRK